MVTSKPLGSLQFLTWILILVFDEYYISGIGPPLPDRQLNLVQFQYIPSTISLMVFNYNLLNELLPKISVMVKIFYFIFFCIMLFRPTFKFVLELRIALSHFWRKNRKYNYRKSIFFVAILILNNNVYTSKYRNTFLFLLIF